MMAVFRFRFASFRFEAKRMAVFCFLFASFRFEAKMMAVLYEVVIPYTPAPLLQELGLKNKIWISGWKDCMCEKEACLLQFFASFSFCFHFVPFSFRFRSLHFASMRNNKKSTFFRIEAKKISLPFRFEAKMTAHPTLAFSLYCTHLDYCLRVP
jgi:hypothetical protein